MTLKLAQQSFSVTPQLMIIHHHTRCGYTRRNDSQNIVRTKCGHRDRWAQWFQYPPIPTPQKKFVARRGAGGIKNKQIKTEHVRIKTMPQNHSNKIFFFSDRPITSILLRIVGKKKTTCTSESWDDSRLEDPLIDLLHHTDPCCSDRVMQSELLWRLLFSKLCRLRMKHTQENTFLFWHSYFRRWGVGWGGTKTFVS